MIVVPVMMNAEEMKYVSYLQLELETVWVSIWCCLFLVNAIYFLLICKYFHIIFVLLNNKYKCLYDINISMDSVFVVLLNTV